MAPPGKWKPGPPQKSGLPLLNFEPHPNLFHKRPPESGSESGSKPSDSGALSAGHPCPYYLPFAKPPGKNKRLLVVTDCD